MWPCVCLCATIKVFVCVSVCVCHTDYFSFDQIRLLSYWITIMSGWVEYECIYRPHLVRMHCVFPHIVSNDNMK